MVCIYCSEECKISVNKSLQESSRKREQKGKNIKLVVSYLEIGEEVSSL